MSRLLAIVVVATSACTGDEPSTLGVPDGSDGEPRVGSDPGPGDAAGRGDPGAGDRGGRGDPGAGDPGGGGDLGGGDPGAAGDTNVCGNGVAEPGEACDDHNEYTETECPYGTAACTLCNADCTAELSLTGGVCGDGMVDAPDELCDDGDTSDCTPPCPADCGVGGLVPVYANFCGDSVARCGEQCDTGDVGIDCTAFGFASAGFVSCDSSCRYDIAACACTASDTDTDSDGTCDLLDDDDDDDGCPDAVDIAPLVAPIDPPDDGDGVPAHCDTCPSDYDPAQADYDGDGFGLACDCNDTVATCTTDCSTNTDADSELDGFVAVDCVEVACGSDPDEGGDVSLDCIWAESDLDSALVVARGIVGREKILVGFDPFGVNPSLDCPVGGVELRFTVPVNVTGNRGLQIGGSAGCTLSGVEISNEPDGDAVIQVVASDTTLRDFYIPQCDLDPVVISASNAWVQNLHVACGGGTGGSIQITEVGDGATIVGNIFEGHPDDAIEVIGADGVTIDHNTFIGPMARAIHVAEASQDLCVRNNLFVDVAAALSIVAGSSWDADCAGALDDATWNNAVSNVTGNCATICGSDCGTVDCLPTDEALFFEFSGVYEVDPGLGIGACITSPNLIDQAADLGYDRNGARAGTFDGAGPDIGGREGDASSCQPRP